MRVCLIVPVLLLAGAGCRSGVRRVDEWVDVSVPAALSVAAVAPHTAGPLALAALPASAAATAGGPQLAQAVAVETASSAPLAAVPPPPRRVPALPSILDHASLDEVCRRLDLIERRMSDRTIPPAYVALPRSRD